MRSPFSIYLISYYYPNFGLKQRNQDNFISSVSDQKKIWIDQFGFLLSAYFNSCSLKNELDRLLLLFLNGKISRNLSLVMNKLVNSHLGLDHSNSNLKYLILILIYISNLIQNLNFTIQNAIKKFSNTTPHCALGWLKFKYWTYIRIVSCLDSQEWR